ncbi:MAG: thiamine-phosphate kinase [Magnetococcales bacterium]|nr:thiamine-phosphate kinase [Magnetococcales bacterium]
MEGVRTIASLGEFGLIRTLFAPLQQAEEALVTGIGDDAAVLAVPRTQHLLVTTDALLEGSHFLRDDDPYLLGQKALRVNLSDIAAMGGQPRWYTLSLALPPSIPVSWVEEFSRGLADTGREYQVNLIGGDTVGTKGCIAITITLLGLVGRGRALGRKGARPGDRLFVSGTIGDATLGLSHRLRRMTINNPDDLAWFQRRFHLPEPRVALGQMLQETALAHALIDISDGLVSELGHLCRESGVGAAIYTERVPLSDAARRVLAGAATPEQKESILRQILTGGEDYELLFAVAEGALDQIEALEARSGTRITEIGRITREAGVISLFEEGHPIKLPEGGFRHF